MCKSLTRFPVFPLRNIQLIIFRLWIKFHSNINKTFFINKLPVNAILIFSVLVPIIGNRDHYNSYDAKWEHKDWYNESLFTLQNMILKTHYNKSSKQVIQNYIVTGQKYTHLHIDLYMHWIPQHIKKIHRVTVENIHWIYFIWIDAEKHKYHNGLRFKPVILNKVHTRILTWNIVTLNDSLHLSYWMKFILDWRNKRKIESYIYILCKYFVTSRNKYTFHLLICMLYNNRKIIKNNLSYLINSYNLGLMFS